MKNFLEQIINIKKKEIKAAKTKRPMIHFVDSKCLLKGIRPFKEAVSIRGSISLIAEIKKKTPSRKEPFFRKFDVPGISKIYAENNAKAISVLTDKRFFGGELSHINKVRSTVHIPVLRKDFIIDEYQVYESRYFGSDAILLIARILSREKMKSFIHLAKRIGMEVIVEIHNEKDLEKALTVNAKIIGINNRDLETFRVDIDNTFRLVSKMPKEVIKISESGIKSDKDICRLREIGINAVLIGSAFLEAKDIGAKAREIMGNTDGHRF